MDVEKTRRLEDGGRKDRRLEVEKMRRQGNGGRRADVRDRRKNKMDDGRPLRWEEGGKGEKLEVGGRRSEVGKGEKVRRSEKQKIGRPPVKSSFGGLPMAAFNGVSGGRKTQDRVKTKFDIKIKNTYDLINKIKNNELPDKIMLNVHPQRWNDEFVPWVRELVWQNVKNVVKRMIVRKREGAKSICC